MEYNTASPIYLQVINELKKRMVKGELKPGEKMPSNRELAVLFKVNQNTAARIYREMESMGLCYTKRGIGTFVSEEDDMISGLKKEMAEELVRNFMQSGNAKTISALLQTEGESGVIRNRAESFACSNFRRKPALLLYTP